MDGADATAGRPEAGYDADVGTDPHWVRKAQQACLDALEQGIVLAGVDGNVRMSNDRAWEILGADPAEFTDRIRSGAWSTYDADGVLIPVEERPVIVTAVSGRPVEGRIIQFDRDDGERVTLRVRTQPVLDDGELFGLVIAFADVSHERALADAQRRAHEEERAAKAVLEAFLERSADLICVHDVDGRVVYASPAAVDVLGEPLAPGDQMPWHRVNREDVDRAISTYRNLAENPGSTERFVARIDSADGWRHLEIVATNRMEDPAIGAIVSNVRDITERAEAAARLSWQAFHDGLTGLPNRALLMDRLTQTLERTRRRGERTVLLFVDLDRFKHVNDERGHEMGDLLLQEVGLRLNRAVRASDTVARFGGDEFVVVVEGDDQVDALADRVRRTLEEPVVVGGASFGVSASIGMAFDNGQSPERLLRDADAALYRAKQRGRNRVEVFDESLRIAAQRRAMVERNLRQCLGDGTLVVHHQPVVSLADGALLGTEALARIPTPSGGIELPGEYVAVAEERGLTLELGAAVLDQVVDTLVGWRDGSRSTASGAQPGFVALNVSGRQLGAPSFASELATAIDDNGLHGGDIVLEITEDTVIGADRSTGRTVAALREMGVRLWLDDFGTGYGSLAYLRRFPLDAVKLDQSFVQGLGVERNDTEIVKAVVGLGESLGLSVVAEGVETMDQLVALRDLGCPAAQGFLLGSPSVPDALRPLGAEVSELLSSPRQ